jgi:hypothetical protein
MPSENCWRFYFFSKITKESVGENIVGVFLPTGKVPTGILNPKFNFPDQAKLECAQIL